MTGSSIKNLVWNYPRAAKIIDMLIATGGKWCARFERYPDVRATSE
jgi:hypothetical protein